MKQLLAPVVLLALFLGCSTNNSSDEIFEGSYTGTFLRTGPVSSYIPSDVSITFDSGKFKGVSSINKYPAICEGTYELIEGKIEFTNECPWTAEFDWSYILSGTFSFSQTSKELIISRAYETEESDTYTLHQE